MKLTVTPADGGPTESLEELGNMLLRVKAMLTDEQGRAPGDARARVRVTVGGKVRSVEVTW